MSGFARRDEGASFGLAALAGVLALLVAGCATGDDGVVPRGGDAGSNPRFDAGPPRDAGTGPVDAGPAPACVPACPTDQVCREGVCVSADVDADEDGVPATIDCDDADPGVGRTIESDCTSSCGAGTRLCMDGVWGECDAPTTCDCADGSAPRTFACGRCGTQRQVCVGGTWVNDGACTGEGACMPGTTETGGSCGRCGTQERTCQADCSWAAYTCTDEGECMAGATDSESCSCPGGCGMTGTRTRTCSASCSWGTFGSCNGCSACGPVCGNGTCESGETCAACADCRYGHMGTGDHGDSCSGVPAETWRCVTDPGLGVVSQYCRNGIWNNFNLDPQNCSACRCSFSTACCQPGSPSTGC